MRGRRSFTQNEAGDIRRLLAATRAASAEEQKRLRQKLRDRDFHISDFHRPRDGFRLEDFDALVRQGEIDIG